MPAACFKSISLNGVSHANNCIDHNTRVNPPDYLLDENRRGANIDQVFIQPKELAEIMAANRKSFGRKMRGSPKPYREAVILLSEDNTHEQIQNCIDSLSEVLKITPMWISVHNDEGHVDQDGVTRKNRHLHLGYTNYNAQEHKMNPLGMTQMKAAQTICASALNLERGRSRKETKRKSLDHGQYRQMVQEREQRSIETQQAVKQAYQFGYTKAEAEAKEQYAAERRRLIESEEAHQADYQNLKKAYEAKLAKMRAGFQQQVDQMHLDYQKQTEELQAELLAAQLADQYKGKLDNTQKGFYEERTARLQMIVRGVKGTLTVKEFLDVADERGEFMDDAQREHIVEYAHKHLAPPEIEKPKTKTISQTPKRDTGYSR